ncbi:MAG: CoB--CoM heterodisulfide reductase iron-sulfur subunit A family protein [Bacteroidales bacterium]
MEKPRTGVYICHCGTNIAKMVDVQAIAEDMKDTVNVIITRDYKYMCSDPGQDQIIKDIKEFNLNRIVVAACSPRIHELTFRKALQKAGLNPYLFQMANIREHVSWVHTDRAKATKKARALVSAAINRVNYHEPLIERSVDINPATLIIGGGISGITAALEIADAGKKIFLIEKSHKLGGHTAEIDLTYPYFYSAQQLIKPLIERVKNNKNIELFLETEVKEISGYIGNFETIISSKNTDKIKLTFGNIIVAIGLSPMDPSPLKNYGYGKFPDVITSSEFENMLLSGNIIKKNGNIPENIAIIHCVGSRNNDYHDYCSRICCTVALKYANQLRSALPKANIYELYADMRSMSKGCEELYTETSRKNIMFLMFDQRNDLPEIKKGNDKSAPLIIEMNEKLSGETIEVPADMVILMTAMEARKSAKEVAHSTGVSLCGNHFFIEKHPKLDPVATTTGGVYIVGGCQSPKDIPDSVSQARAAAARILGVIVRGTAKVSATAAYINSSLCCGCQMCLSICPYTAITYDEEKKVSVVNEVLCQGCGTCVALCRPKAINIYGCSHIQMMTELSALLLSD